MLSGVQNARECSNDVINHGLRNIIVLSKGERMRELTKFLKWIKQFNDPEEWEIYAYEGEVQGIIVSHKTLPYLEDKNMWNSYCFHNYSDNKDGYHTFDKTAKGGES